MTAWIQKRWTEFFLTEEVPYAMALVRITLPLTLLVGVLPRWMHARELYSTDGVPTPLWTSYGSSALVPDLSATVAVGLFSLLVFCLVTASLGWRTRLSLLIATVLYAGFGLLDVVSTLTKYTVLATHAMLLLMMSDCGAIWSVDSWLQQRKEPALMTARPTTAVWPRRLMQLLIAICYLGSAFTKMHTPAYFSGDQMMFWLLANVNFENRVGEYLSLFPSFSVLSAYVTILWEILFVAVIWRRPGQYVMLAIGVVFHVMSALTLGLIVFPLVCLSLYLVFVEQADAERLAVATHNLARRWKLIAGRSSPTFVRNPPAWLTGSSSMAAFAMLAALTTVIGTEVEYHVDAYAERGPDGPASLNVLDGATAQAMLGPEQPIRPQDLFFSFDVGTTTMGGRLVDRQQRFQSGDQAILQCSMTPPHPDMWVEVSLQDTEQRDIRRFGQIVTRETLRSNFTYEFDDILTPGKYDFVLMYDDHEIARRRVQYEGAPAGHQPTSKLTAAR